MNVRWMMPVACVWMMSCMIEEIGTGDGSITVSNRDAVDYPVVISDTEQCLFGLNSSLEDGTVRTFSVGEKSFFCLKKGGSGISVQDGGKYEVKDGVFSPL